MGGVKGDRRRKERWEMQREIGDVRRDGRCKGRESDIK